MTVDDLLPHTATSATFPRRRSLAGEIRGALYAPGGCYFRTLEESSKAEEEAEKSEEVESSGAEEEAAALTAEHAANQSLASSDQPLAARPLEASSSSPREEGALKKGPRKSLKTVIADRVEAKSVKKASPQRQKSAASLSNAEIFFESLKINNVDAILENVEKKVKLNTAFYMKSGQFTFWLCLNFYFVASMVHIPEMEYDQILFASVRLVDFLIWLYFFRQFMDAYWNYPEPDEAQLRTPVSDFE